MTEGHPRPERQGLSHGGEPLSPSETESVADSRAGASSRHPLELWAGAECTVNRVGEVYFDQLQRTQHETRLDDLERLAALGVRRVRFPILWERTAPGRINDADFRWSDVRMERLVKLGLEPIVGLVHHGSGPRCTNLCDPGFAAGLAEFAARVAARYPWVNAYTPVNEPLTTARFSGLYGLWYPHQKQLRAFFSALLNEVLATRASMERIRRINPRAELYQTEDIGKVFATADLGDQCRYENQRCWLSLDLLFGRVGADHPLRRHLEEHGVESRLLDQLCNEPCPPDLVGVNYYVTSDRFLDSRLERYPRAAWGGNTRQHYADVEAVRARAEGIVGHAAVLENVWRRYRAPCALTEVHLACHREEQLRWLAEAWRGAQAARAAGADVRAVTLWSAFGAVGWNNLVTRESGEYEPGAYDIRAPEPRRTALAQLAQSLSRGNPVEAPAARGAGWWRRPSRLLYDSAPSETLPLALAPRLLVIGGGARAARIAELCARRFECITAASFATARSALERALRPGPGRAHEPPWAVVLSLDPAYPFAGSPAELQRHWGSIRQRCASSPRILALSCGCVFDGWSARPYVESDVANSNDREGERWRSLEQAVSRLTPDPLLVRPGFLMDARLPDDPLRGALAMLREGRVPPLSSSVQVSPSYLPDLMDAALDLLVDAERGVWHLVPRNTCSLLDLVRSSAERLGLSTKTRAPQSARSSARGPMQALGSERGWPLPDLDAALDAYTQGLQAMATKPDAA
jgi:dTDP-4-dehydrorhamnose reductase